MNLLTSNMSDRLGHSDNAFRLILAIFLVYWLCMLPTLLGFATAGQAASRVLTVPAMLMMFWVAAAKTAQLARGFTVLGQLQAPLAFRRELVAGQLGFVTGAWAFLATGLTLQLALPQSKVSALSGAALISLAACLGVLRELARARLVAKKARQLLDVAPYLALVALLLLDLNLLLERSANIHPLVLGAAAIAFPCLRLWLDRRWRTALPPFRWAEAPHMRGIGAALAMRAKRYTVLTWRSEATPGQHALPMRIVALLVPFVLMRPVWGDGQVHIPGAISLLGAAVLAAGGLLVRDLHWRSLLIPGGMRHGRLAGHVVWSTWTIQCATVFFATVAFLAIGHFKLGWNGEQISALAMRSSLMLVELLFVTSLATWLRGLPVWVRIWTSLGGVVLIAFSVALVIAMARAAQAAALPLASYLLVLCGASAVLVLLANRLWSVNKLLAEAGRAAPGMHR